MKPLQILMPMGGLGQRFRDAGINTPKPLIEVNGTPMFQRALASYDSYPGEKEYIFVIRKDTDDEYKLANQLLALIPAAKIQVLDHNTRGAVETCLVAEDFIDSNNPLVIMDCDIAFDSHDYFKKIESSITNDDFDGLLLSFESEDPRYSFAEIDETNTVIKTAEKVAISNHALMGAYFFASGKTFLDAAHTLIAQPITESMKEYYVSILFNILIAENKRIGLAEGIFYCFGTPDELQLYLDATHS